MTLTFGSLFSGCGGIDLAFERAGFRCAWQCEIDAEARRVLARHWPDVPCHEDVRQVGRHNLAPVDVIVGGFPCQSVSVAGLRAGFADLDKSGLFYEMARVVDELRPTLLLWENVPGLLSSNGGRDFLVVLMELGRLRYSGGWTSLDAQFFGVAQRRRRVFGVFARSDIGTECAVEILALRTRGQGHPPQGREAGADVAYALAASARGTGDGHGQGWNTSYATADGQSLSDTAATLRSRKSNPGVNPPGRGGEDDQNLVAFQANGAASERSGAVSLAASDDNGTNQLVTHALTSAGADASEDGTGRGTPLAVVPIDMRQASRGETMTNNRREDAASGGPPGTGIGEEGDPAPSLANTHTPAVAYQCHGGNVGPMGTLRQGNGGLTGGVPFIINAAESCAKESHARETDTARCLDQTGGFAANQGGTVIGFSHTQGVDPQPSATARPSLRAGGGGHAVGFTELGEGHQTYQKTDVAVGVRTSSGGGDTKANLIADAGMMVRRLTPTECLRLMGMPDDWLDLDPPLSDTTKYRLCGNGVVRQVPEWIARRICRVLNPEASKP